MLMKYGAPVYCLAVQTKQLSWSTKCTTGVLVKHGTPVYCLAVQVKQPSWGAKPLCPMCPMVFTTELQSGEGQHKLTHLLL